MTSRNPHILLGIDGGGTKTEVVACSLDGGEAVVESGPGSNYQGTGIVRAQGVWRELVMRSLSRLGANGTVEVAAAGFGLAGLDRPRDERTIRSALFGLFPPALPHELVNDADLALRAGTAGGVGVAVVSGTGCNAMGKAADGRRFRVAGIGPDFGDLGSASDIGVEALRAAFRSLDGRGPATALERLLRQRLHLERLDDMVDFFLADHESGGTFHTGALAPLVFEAAAGGDGEALRILRWAGEELARSALAVARALFQPTEEFSLVMGGSVLQRGRTVHIREELSSRVRAEFRGASPTVLAVRPVAGALLLALDQVQVQRPELVTAEKADRIRGIAGEMK